MNKKMVISEETKRLLSIMDNGIVITDEETHVLYVNSAFLKFTKMKEEDFIGKILRSVRPGSQLHIALQNKSPIINLRRKEGGVESYVSLLPIMEKDDVIGGLVVIKEATVLESLMDDYMAIKRREQYLAHNESQTAPNSFNRIIGRDKGLKKSVELAKQFAKQDGYILITGESGVGKEVFANAIHRESNRAEGPFVAVNCSAISETLWESEFFGYVGGAFTGAKKDGKVGYFELAKGGTLFLDEIGEIPFQLQAKLLRVLEEKKIRRVGSEKEISTDVRIIAATNENLFEKAAKGNFRVDLFYRIAVLPIVIPPLRDRKDDIDELIDYFIEIHNRKRKTNLGIDLEARNILKEYEWPGNVRELRNVMEFLESFQSGNYIITKQNLPAQITRDLSYDSEGLKLRELVKKYEKNVVINRIRKNGDDLDAKKRVADDLGISLATLYNILNY